MVSKGFGKVFLKEDFDDSDLFVVLVVIEEDVLIENINCMFCKWFYYFNIERKDYCDINII